MINAPNNHAVLSVHRVGVHVTPERPAVGAGLLCGHQESPYAVLRPDELAPQPLQLFHGDCHLSRQLHVSEGRCLSALKRANHISS